MSLDTVWKRGFSSPPHSSAPSIPDPFADAGDNDVKGKDAKDYVHVRVQQRNGKKCLTTVQGLPKKFDLDKILKALKKGECRHAVGAAGRYLIQECEHASR